MREAGTIHQIDEFPSTLDIKSNTLEFKLVSRKEVQYVTNPSYLDLDKIELPLTIRNWKEGDKLSPLGMNGSKLVSDVLIDKKISQFEKRSVLVIEDQKNRIISIPGLIIAEPFKVDDTSVNFLQINLTQST